MNLTMFKPGGALRRLSSGLLGAALLSAHAMGQTATPGTPDVVNPGTDTPASTFVTGLSAHFQYGNVGATATEFDNIQATGAKMLRVDAAWELIENTATAPGTDSNYNFNYLDNIKALAEARGMNLLIILCYGNTRYTSTEKTPPLTGTALAKWKEYVAAVAKRYPNAWLEVWNEPDYVKYNNGTPYGPFWEPVPDAQSYVTFLGHTSTAIRAARARLGLTAHVMMGGLAVTGSSTRNFPNDPAIHNSMTWFRDALNQGALSYVDSISFHPYPYSQDPLRGNTNRPWHPSVTAEPAINVRNVLNNWGAQGSNDPVRAATIPIYATETGSVQYDYAKPSMDSDAYGSSAVTNLVMDSSTPGFTSAGNNPDVSGSGGWKTFGAQASLGTGPSALPPELAGTGATSTLVTPAASGESGFWGRNRTAAYLVPTVNGVPGEYYYTVSAWMRASTPRLVRMGLQNEGDFNNHGITFRLETGWRRFSFTFRRTSDSNNTVPFQVYTDDGSTPYEIAAPMCILSANQGAPGTPARAAYEAAFIAKKKSMVADNAREFMRAAKRGGAAGAFLFSWRDIPGCTSGIADANGALKTGVAPSHVGCLNAP